MIYNSIIFLILCFVIYKIYKLTLKINMQDISNLAISDFIKNFDSYVATLHYQMSIAYDIIYKDSIMIYSIEATSPKDSEINDISKDFVKLVLELLGPAMEKFFVAAFGSEESLYANMIVFFNEKIEKDQIRKTSLDNFMGNNESDLELENLLKEKLG